MVTVTDSDDDTDSAAFTVAVVDDTPVTSVTETIDEDSDGFEFTISADATADTLAISQNGSDLTGTATDDGGMEYSTEYGTVTVSADGAVSYTPDANYSGQEVFSVAGSEDDGTSSTTTVTVNVTPVSDAAAVSVDDAEIATLEDTSVALGLNAPVLTDDGTEEGQQRYLREDRCHHAFGSARGCRAAMGYR